jgi:hypothetical protein
MQGKNRLGDFLALDGAATGLQAAPWTGTDFC